jgi:hypothetical protein
MTKGELRKLRKQARTNGGSWNIETNEQGQATIVHTRTIRQEQKYQKSLDKWARAYYENN